jgi:hypothetical protein
MAPHVAGTIPDIIGEDMRHPASIHGYPSTLEEIVDHFLDNTDAFSPDHGVAWAENGDTSIPLWDEPQAVDWADVRLVLAEMVVDLGSDADWGGWYVSIVEVD